MFYRCLNDFFAYCEGTPKENDKPIESAYMLNRCSKDPKTCGHCRKESNHFAPTTPKTEVVKLKESL